MTPLEEQKMRAAAARQLEGQIDPRAAAAAGMFNPNAGADNSALERAAGSTRGAEARLKQQQDYANALRGGKMPEGREVGPSGIYVQANAGEMAKYVADQAIGGYLAGQTGEAADALDAAQTDINIGALELEDIRTDEANAYSTGERVAGQDFDAAQSKLSQAVERELQGKRLGSAEAIADNRLGQDYAGMKGVEYVDTKNPGQTVNTVGSPNGRLMRDPQTGQMVPVDESRYVPMGDLVAAKREDLDPTGTFGPDYVPNKVAAPNVVSRLMTDPESLSDSTGMFNLSRYIGSTGYGEGGEQIQDTQRDMATVGIQGMAANLETMEAKPVSDFESRMAMLPVPDRNTKPYGWVAWSANDYRPALARETQLMIDESRAAGDEAKAVRQEELRANILQNHDMDTVYGAVSAGYPKDRLVKSGIDPDLVDYMKDLKDRGLLEQFMQQNGRK